MADSILHSNHARGSASPRAAMTEAQVLEIAALLRGGEHYAMLAKRLGLPRDRIGRIARGQFWQWLTRIKPNEFGVYPVPRGQALIIKASIPDPATGCWIWQRATTAKPDGTHRRGTLTLRIDGRAVLWMASRYSWTSFRGPIPDGLFVLHECDNPLCVNPDHLFLGTQKDNIDDMFSKGRQYKGPRPLGSKVWNAKLTEGQVREIRHRLLAGETCVSIAASYAVKWQTIATIKSGRSWKHVVA